VPAAWLSQPGSFKDAVQQQAGQMLGQQTQGRKDVALVFYFAEHRAVQPDVHNSVCFGSRHDRDELLGFLAQPFTRGTAIGKLDAGGAAVWCSRRAV
jgi:hypothetical protein